MREINGQIVLTNESDGPRGFKNCECYKCGYIGKCTPAFDFYTTDESDGKFLCEFCFRIYISKQIKN